MKNVIYCIENKINKSRYVGSAVSFSSRKALHLKRLNNNTHHSQILQKSWNKNGAENFIFFILEVVNSKEVLIEREQWWIDNSDSKYNVCKKAGSSLGVKRSEETKQKIRIANLGIKHPKWRNEIKSKAQGGDKHWTKKKCFSEESKSKMSESKKKLYKNGYVSPLKGTKVSRELVLSHIDKVSKPILQYDLEYNLIREWLSAKEASMEKYSASHISQCCKNKRKTHKKFIWRYKRKQYQLQ